MELTRRLPQSQKDNSLGSWQALSSFGRLLCFDCHFSIAKAYWFRVPRQATWNVLLFCRVRLSEQHAERKLKSMNHLHWFHHHLHCHFLHHVTIRHVQTHPHQTEEEELSFS